MAKPDFDEIKFFGVSTHLFDYFRPKTNVGGCLRPLDHIYSHFGWCTGTPGWPVKLAGDPKFTEKWAKIENCAKIALECIFKTSNHHQSILRPEKRPDMGLNNIFC